MLARLYKYARVSERRLHMANLNWLDVAEKLAPAVLSAIPGIPPTLVPIVVDAVQQAEGLTGANGADKKAAAMSIVGDAIKAFNTAKKTVVIKEAAVMPLISAAVDAVVAAVNTTHDAAKSVAAVGAAPAGASQT